MIIRVLILDDIEEWARDLQDSINELDSTFFSSIDTKVTKIAAVYATTTEAALEILTTQKIDLFSIDIKLNGEERGHEFYERLFLNGIDIPSIVVSAEVNTKEIRDEIIGKGVPIIVRKLSSGEPIHIRVAKAICEVIDSPEKMAFELTTYVQNCGIENEIISYNGNEKTIKNLLEYMITEPISIEERYVLKELIKKACIDEYNYR